MQTVGLTDITVDYSSPGVKGRKIWGEVVPYGQVWRTGANMATKITFSKEVTVGTTTVPAGSYAFFAIPTADSWTLILNKNFNQGGAFGYSKDLDLVRIDVKPEAIANRERLAYVVGDFNNEQANISLEWEKIRVSLPVKLGTDAQVASTLKALDNGDQYLSAARYFVNNKDFDSASAWADKALKVKETPSGEWTKAQALAGKGKFKDALAMVQKAQQSKDKGAQELLNEDDVKKQIADWKTKK